MGCSFARSPSGNPNAPADISTVSPLSILSSLFGAPSGGEISGYGSPATNASAEAAFSAGYGSEFGAPGAFGSWGGGGGFGGGYGSGSYSPGAYGGAGGVY